MVTHKVIAIPFLKSMTRQIRALRPSVSDTARRDDLYVEKILDVSHPHHTSVAKMGQNGAQILGKDVLMLAHPL